MSRLILFFDGDLQLAEDFTPTYIGGRNRPLQINDMISLDELKLTILRALNHDYTTHTVNLACRLRNNGNYTAIRITDDEVCAFVLAEGRRRTVVVYVEFEELPGLMVRPESPPRMRFDNPRHSTYISRSAPIIPDPSSSRRTSVSSRPTFDLNIPTFITESPSLMHNIEACIEPDEGQSNIPPNDASIPAYETMYSGSSENSSGDVEAPLVEEVELTMRTDHIIQHHTSQNMQNLDDMVVNNEFVKKIHSTEEWDASDHVDPPIHHHHEEFDAIIPDQLHEGMTFGSKETLQCALAGWSITKNVEYKKFSSNKQRLTVLCVQSEHQSRPCLWRLHAAKSKRLGGAWKISTITGRHTCTNPVLSANHRNCTSKFICQYITATLRQQLDLKPREIITRISSKFDVQVSYMKAWDARRKAIRSVFGSYEESFTLLYRMMEAIRLAVPGSVYNIQVTQGIQFKSIFWSFGPSIEGWQYCRPVLSLDGTFLLGKYRGTLLAAVGVDGNGGLYPLAFAVVESESVESWTWFLQMLHDKVVIIQSRRDLCIISDKHAGLIRGCSEIFPWAAHRHCLCHLRENFKKTLRRLAIPDCDTVCDKMYWAGNTDDLKVHERYMTDIQNIKKEAYDWLIERDRRKWALTRDGGFRYGVMTTNASECFNGVLRRARGLPIQGLIMTVYYNLVTLFLKRTSNAHNWLASDNSMLVPRTKAILELAEHQARRSPLPTQISSHEFEVFDMSCRSYRLVITSAQTCTCSCGHPQIYHIPCKHAVIALGSRRWDHNAFVSLYYTLANYKESYSANFHVIPDRTLWPPYSEDQGIIPLLAPALRRRSGRPRTNRYRNSMDETRGSSTRTCSFCHSRGHNIATCPSNPSTSRRRQ